MEKEGHFDIFECVRRIYNFSWKTRTCTSQRGRMVTLLNNATHMQPVHTQNLPETSKDVS